MNPTGKATSTQNGTRRVRQMAKDFLQWARRSEHRRAAWPSEIGRGYLSLHARRRRRQHVAAADRAARSEEVIRRARRLATALGAGSGTAVTAAAMFASIGEGAGGLVSFPLAAACAGSELMTRTLVHLATLCELADIYGCPFGRRDITALMRLYTLALKGARRSRDGAGGVTRLLDREADDLGAWLSNQLVSETIARNIVPFVGVVTSSTTNWRLTTRVGRFARRHFVIRRSLEEVVWEIERRDPNRCDALVEGLWFLFAADGAITAQEAALLTHFVGIRPDRVRQTLTSRMTDDESEWIARLHDITSDEVRGLIFRGLEIASAAGGAPIAAELAVLRHAGASLGHSLDPDRIAAVLRDFEEAGIARAPQRMSAAP